MEKQEKPFRYLTQEEFLRLSEADRLEYLQSVNDHLAVRIALMGKPGPERKS